MNLLQIVPINQLPTKKAKKVGKINSQIKQLAHDMAFTMMALDGLGLAAPQVGHNIRMIALRTSQTQAKILINPEVTMQAGDFVAMFEGCLSIPQKQVEVVRPEAIKVKFKNLDKSISIKDFSGLDARVIQHEVDHLDGLTMYHRARRAVI